MAVVNDPNFIKWINASVNIYFKAAAGALPLYIDGQEIQFETEPKIIELRLTGPRVKEYNKDDFSVEIDVNLMCSCKLGTNDYSIHEVVGAVFPASAGPIPIYKHDGTISPEYVGCFILKNDPQRDVIPWGLVQVTDGPIRVNLTSIEAFYEMNL